MPASEIGNEAVGRIEARLRAAGEARVDSLARRFRSVPEYEQGLREYLSREILLRIPRLARAPGIATLLINLEQDYGTAVKDVFEALACVGAHREVFLVTFAAKKRRALERDLRAFQKLVERLTPLGLPPEVLDRSRDYFASRRKRQELLEPITKKRAAWDLAKRTKKNVLMQEPPCSVTELLIRRRVSRLNAYETTARLLFAWDPEAWRDPARGQQEYGADYISKAADNVRKRWERFQQDQAKRRARSSSP